MSTGVREGLRAWLVHALAVPTIATVKLRSRVSGGFYLTGGVIVVLATLGTASWDAADIASIRAIGYFAILTGPLLILFGHRLPRGAYHGISALGTALISGLVLYGHGGEASVALAIPYLYVILDAAFFFGIRGLACHIGLITVAASLSMHHVGLSSADTVLIVGVAVVTGLVVASLARAANLAEEDPLTGLGNRRAFDRRLEEDLARTQHEHSTLALILLDLDNFKIVNDGHGHQVGDQMLVACADAWREVLRDELLLSRYGGDEFAAILPDHSLGRAADIADRLREVAPSGVTISAGVACWAEGDTASVLLGRADVALYEAKSAGRDQTVVYGDPTRGASELEAAIGAGELFLNYQPVIRLSDGAVVRTEALVRWQHPRRGLVPPMDFIPQAERTGAIHALGEWTLQKACSETAFSCANRGVAVNVSVPELRNPSYAEIVKKILVVSGLRPDRLTLEVTEALFDEDDPQVVRTLKELRAFGVQVAIDDFGTGYSSLSWLEKFPIDVVKIDRSFVQAIDPDRDRQPVLSAIMAICGSLGVSVIGEGVETPEQAQVLRDLGVDLAQGYLFGKPMPFAQLPAEPAIPAPR
ncbi:MAG: putative bifunctional diguanylate cyclase/phosphodiesterase [Nocardioides sp.]